MADSNNTDLKAKITELLKATPSSTYSSYRMTTRQKIAEGIRRGGLTASGFYKDTSSQLVAWRDAFCKTGHNILENMKKDKE